MQLSTLPAIRRLPARCAQEKDWKDKAAIARSEAQADALTKVELQQENEALRSELAALKAKYEGDALKLDAAAT